MTTEVAYREGYLCYCGQLYLVKQGPSERSPRRCGECHRGLAPYRITRAEIQSWVDEAARLVTER